MALFDRHDEANAEQLRLLLEDLAQIREGESDKPPDDHAEPDDRADDPAQAWLGWAE
jgi:hypothetical protein